MKQIVRAERVDFENASGERLAARLERPLGEPAGYALFAHCFTCSKDIAAASRISRALATLGFGVLRFDFTGLGNSEGDFSNTNFSSNVTDLLDAVTYLRTHAAAPTLLVGHSLGGAAVLAAAPRVPEARAVVTIGAPASPAHVSHLFDDARSQIEAEGSATVSLGGREFRIKKQFLDDIAEQTLDRDIKSLRKALLVMHAPLDEIVSIDNASRIFQNALHPKSFVSLDTADHLLSRPQDSRYVADTIAAWASRYLPTLSEEEVPRPTVAAGEVLVHEKDGKFAQHVYTQHHLLDADEPTAYGGADSGPSPYELLLSALGTCTAMTIRMYAQRKKLDLKTVSVRLRHDKIHAEDCEHCETASGKLDRIERSIELDGSLSEEQRASLLAIADKCPVHRSLHGEIDIVTTPI